MCSPLTPSLVAPRPRFRVSFSDSRRDPSIGLPLSQPPLQPGDGRLTRWDRGGSSPRPERRGGTRYPEEDTQTPETGGVPLPYPTPRPEEHPPRHRPTPLFRNPSGDKTRTRRQVLGCRCQGLTVERSTGETEVEVLYLRETPQNIEESQRI